MPASLREGGKWIQIPLTLLLLQIPVPAAASSETLHRVKGTAFCSETGSLHIYLADRETFSKPFTGTAELILTIPEPGLYSWEFRHIPGGIYAVRAFLDTDGNGRLNRGITGPSEPWAFSREVPGTRRKPDFEKASLTVDGTQSPVRLILK